MFAYCVPHIRFDLVLRVCLLLLSFLEPRCYGTYAINRYLLPPFCVSPPRGRFQYTLRTDLPWVWCCLFSMVHICNIDAVGGH